MPPNNRRVANLTQVVSFVQRETTPAHEAHLRDILSLIGQLTAGDWQARAAPVERDQVLDPILAALNRLAHVAAGSFELLRQDRDALELRVSVRMSDMEQHYREISVLGLMGDMLQSTITNAEAYAIVAQFAEQLFPFASGTLFIFSSSRNVIEVMAHWGAVTSLERVFAPEDCWALRRGHVYQVDKEGASLLCRHVPATCTLGASLCLPLSAHGEILGMVHLCIAPRPELPDWTAYLKALKNLATIFVERVSLAVANLNLREKARSLSIRDPLTNLFNRRYLEESLERELRRAERTGTQVCLMMLDIDHYKRFNDTYGHGAGDRVLHKLGVVLKTHVRGSDLAGRYGGEEFALFLPETSLDEGRQRAEEIRATVNALNVSYQNQPLGQITLSVGVAAFPEHGTTGDSLVRAADGALYCAKREGRDRVVVA